MKVKAHSNDTFNNIADNLTKQGLSCKPIQVQIKAFTDSLLCPIWNHIGAIDTNPRKWIKKVLQSRIFTSFLFNNNIDQTSTLVQLIGNIQQSGYPEISTKGK
jgi:hypothetical protein